MNILITIYRGLGYGGAEVSTKLMAHGLEKLGNKVIIAASDDYEGLETRKFREFGGKLFKSQEKYLSKFLVDIIKRENIDIIYAQDRLTSVPSILAAKKTGVKSAVHFRDYWFACPYSSCLAPDGFEYDKCNLGTLLKHFKKSRFLIDLYKLRYLKRARKILKKANVKFALSTAVKRRLDINGVKDSIVVTSARKFGEFNGRGGGGIRKKYSLREKVITFIGSLTYSKGIMNMVKIMPDILNERISFLIVGDGPLLEDIKNKNLEGVVLTGRLKAEEMPDIYAASNLIVLPSVWQEPFSGILHESAAAGKAILAANTGGSKDAMEENKLVEANNLEEWKRRIKELIEDDNLREKWALDYSKRARERYEVKVVAKKVNEIFEKL
jgi:glycosyltransferase involved in cell wall biosynthesis